MSRLYIPWHDFWVRQRILRFSRKLLGAVAILLSACFSAGLLYCLAFYSGSHADSACAFPSVGNARDRYEMRMANLLSDALEGIRSTPKVYWLSDSEPVAPKPDASCYGETSDPGELKKVLAQAQTLLNGQSLYFDPYGERKPDTTVRYYLDETILAISWKEIHDSCVYSFSEIKIAHPSQFRRFLSGNTYGNGQQFLTTEMSESVNAVVASAGDFYGYRQFGTVIYGSQIYRYQGSLDLCLVDEQGDLRFLYAGHIPEQDALQQYILDNNIRFSLAFGPVLVENGRRVSNDYYLIGETGDNYSRAALCQMGQLHYLLSTANHETDYPMVPTIAEFGRRIAETGCTMAYTLDGGQTATLVMNNQLVNQVSYGAQRRISDIIYFATALPDGG